MAEKRINVVKRGSSSEPENESKHTKRARLQLSPLPSTSELLITGEKTPTSKSTPSKPAPQILLQCRLGEKNPELKESAQEAVVKIGNKFIRFDGVSFTVDKTVDILSQRLGSFFGPVDSLQMTEKPVLICTMGNTGTGKTTLLQGLAEINFRGLYNLVFPGANEDQVKFSAIEISGSKTLKILDLVRKYQGHQYVIKEVHSTAFSELGRESLEDVLKLRSVAKNRPNDFSSRSFVLIRMSYQRTGSTCWFLDIAGYETRDDCENHDKAQQTAPLLSKGRLELKNFFLGNTTSTTMWTKVGELLPPRADWVLVITTKEAAKAELKNVIDMLIDFGRIEGYIPSPSLSRRPPTPQTEDQQTIVELKRQLQQLKDSTKSDLDEKNQVIAALGKRLEESEQRLKELIEAKATTPLFSAGPGPEEIEIDVSSPEADYGVPSGGETSSERPEQSPSSQLSTSPIPDAIADETPSSSGAGLRPEEIEDSPQSSKADDDGSTEEEPQEVEDVRRKLRTRPPRTATSARPKSPQINIIIASPPSAGDDQRQEDDRAHSPNPEALGGILEDEGRSRTPSPSPSYLQDLEINFPLETVELGTEEDRLKNLQDWAEDHGLKDFFQSGDKIKTYRITDPRIFLAIDWAKIVTKGDKDYFCQCCLAEKKKGVHRKAQIVTHVYHSHYGQSLVCDKQKRGAERGEICGKKYAHPESMKRHQRNKCVKSQLKRSRLR